MIEGAKDTVYDERNWYVTTARLDNVIDEYRQDTS